MHGIYIVLSVMILNIRICIRVRGYLKHAGNMHRLFLKYVLFYLFVCLFVYSFIYLGLGVGKCLTMLSTLALQLLGSRDPPAQAFLVMELQAEATTEGGKGLQM